MEKIGLVRSHYRDGSRPPSALYIGLFARACVRTPQDNILTGNGMAWRPGHFADLFGNSVRHKTTPAKVSTLFQPALYLRRDR